MFKKSIPICLIALSILLLPLSPALAQSEGIPLQKDVILGAPIFGAADLPDEVTFNLYDSQTAIAPIGTQAFARGQYTVDFEFSQSDGITAGDVARVTANFTNKLNIDSDPESATQTKEIWMGIEVAGTEIGDRAKVSDGTLVQLLLASDASIATYLTLVYEGDDNPITTIYKDLPVSSLSSDGSGSSLSNYFSAVAGAASDTEIGPNALTDPNNWFPSGSNIYYNNGNVAIGATNPSNDLLVYDGSANCSVRVQRGSNVIVELIAGSAVGTIGTANNYPIRFRTNNQNRMTLDTAGNTGLGTVLPQAKLHVYDLTKNADVKVTRFGGTNVQILAGSAVGSIGTVNNKAFRIKTNDINRMTIDTAGNVGIGTTIPTYELAVNGTIRCKELIVDTGWSDFVFEKDYRLPSLREVEQHIQEKGHLPGIPTEAQVKENGVSVGEISSRLLQKIEELTLYVIDLKKENNALKGHLAAIQKQLQGDKE